MKSPSLLLGQSTADEVANSLLEMEAELVVQVAAYLWSDEPEAEEPANALRESHAQAPSWEPKTLKTASAYRAQSPEAFASSALPASVRL